MSKAKTPLDGDGLYEEIVRRNKERERCEWLKLVARHVLSKREGRTDLVLKLLALQRLESGDLINWQAAPAEEFPAYWDGVQLFKRRIVQAARDCDRKFSRRLLDAQNVIASGKIKDPLGKLTSTGFALAAWGQLCDELGHRPRGEQLRKRFERLRKEEAGKTSSVSDRQWERILKYLKPLFRSGG